MAAACRAGSRRRGRGGAAGLGGATAGDGDLSPLRTALAGDPGASACRRRLRGDGVVARPGRAARGNGSRHALVWAGIRGHVRVESGEGGAEAAPAELRGLLLRDPEPGAAASRPIARIGGGGALRGRAGAVARTRPGRVVYAGAGPDDAP